MNDQPNSVATLSEIKGLPLRQVQTVKKLLWNDEAKGQLAAVAAKHMNPEAMMRVMANAIRTTPKLADCDVMSFLGAMMQCASLGLQPNTIMGHAYLIPFGKAVQLVIGYKGLIDLARRSGHVTAISANIHYKDDELWEYEEGTEATLRHRPGPQGGQKLHAYAIAKFKDGGHAYVVLPWSHVMKIRDGSQNWQNAKRAGKTATTPWFTHEDAMAKKTAIRALSKYLPLTVEYMEATQVDEARADYRGYAANPTMGLMIESAQTDDEDMSGADISEDGEVMDQETQDKPQKAAPPVETRKAAEPTPAKRAHRATKIADPAPAQEQQAAPAADPTQSSFYRGVMNDVKSMGAKDAMDLHWAELQTFKNSGDPAKVAVHDALMVALIVTKNPTLDLTASDEAIAEQVSLAFAEPAPTTRADAERHPALATAEALQAKIAAAETADAINDVWHEARADLELIKDYDFDLHNKLAELADDRAERLITQG